MTSVTTTPGTAGAVSGAVSLQARAASASTVAKAGAATRKIPRRISQLQCGFIEQIIMHKCATMGENPHSTARTLALLSSLVLVKTLRESRHALSQRAPSCRAGWQFSTLRSAPKLRRWSQESCLREVFNNDYEYRPDGYPDCCMMTIGYPLRIERLFKEQPSCARR